ncbi:DNA mismatch repair protein [Flavobacterium sp. SUN052]|uniref:MutS-related protein n=1 Tax=Flavobacterium sp. SUN052 TaxID=3002441 RepID=UPI00237D4E0E|nr:DNA mismatch repair protein [Flavobacterium sp. SUN052]MEC4005887.1 DNA mismatch repair protein [Flavobacterium sp. SUN052]
MEIYNDRKIQFEQELNELKKKYNLLSTIRLVCGILIIISGYYFLKTYDSLYLTTFFVLIVVFVFLMKKHDKINNQRKLKEALIAINTDEIAYLSANKLPFENGIEFNDFSHPYCYDLDIFSNHSLFQNLNRTNTFIGKITLVSRLMKSLSNDEILKNQEGVKELSHKIDWRQNFSAIAKVGKDSKLVYQKIINWSTSKSEEFTLNDTILSFVTPIAITISFVAYLVTSNDVFLKAIGYLFAINLGIIGRFYKRIKFEINHTTEIDAIVKQYGLLIQSIENEAFESEKLNNLKQKLASKNQNASAELKKLSELFSKMDTINNLVVSLVFNGLFLFHAHTLKSLLNWKKENAASLKDWLGVIGEYEMLNSLANFSYNNSDFAFPEINANYEISFSDLSHPLLNSKTRIGNDVSFQPQSFMILTGSNMSGKSTFLRSLGINMVLTGIGAPVCASKANVHPLPILVSMRLSDSLSDSESYFFAEIKRLKLIMDNLEGNRAFVLLDEILRGTNSDDKRNGTIEVVKKMISKSAIGAIATHDIEVCLTTNEFPNQLTNKCFEVEIVNDDLHFDYKLRDGICKNKSATFLMKKIGVI